MTTRHLDLITRQADAGGAHSVNVNDAHQEYQASLGLNGKVANVLTAVYGSMYFVYALALFMTGWMLLQGWLGHRAWDPYPFLLLLFIGNLVQLLGGPIIQVGQNLHSRHGEMRAEADFAVNQATHAQLAELTATLKAFVAAPPLDAVRLAEIARAELLAMQSPPPPTVTPPAPLSDPPAPVAAADAPPAPVVPTPRLRRRPSRVPPPDAPEPPSAPTPPASPTTSV